MKIDILLAANKPSKQDLENQARAKRTGFWGRAAAGCLPVANGQLLFNQRSLEIREGGTWGTWGGAIEGKERPWQTALRELREETGYKGKVLKLVPLLVFKAPGFEYHNFLAVLPSKFKPKLDWESHSSAWAGLDEIPRPQHPGLKALLAHPPSLATIKHWLERTKR